MEVKKRKQYGLIGVKARKEVIPCRGGSLWVLERRCHRVAVRLYIGTSKWVGLDRDHRSWWDWITV